MGAKTLNLKVGLFVITSVVIFFIFVFILGGEQNFLKKTYRIQTSFTNVAGLAEGAMNGI